MFGPSGGFSGMPKPTGMGVQAPIGGRTNMPVGQPQRFNAPPMQPSMGSPMPQGGMPGNSAFGHSQGNQNGGFMPPGLQQGGFQQSHNTMQPPIGQGQGGMQNSPFGMSPELLQALFSQIMGQRHQYPTPEQMSSGPLGLRPEIANSIRF